MPQLKIQTSVATQNLQLAVVQQAETDARRLAASFIMPLPLPNMNKILATYVAPIHQMQETLRSLPFIAMNNMIAETMRSQTNILAMITNAHYDSYAGIAKAASIGIFPPYIIDAEIVDNPQKVDSSKLQNAVIPYQPSASTLTIPEQSPWKRCKMGLKEISGGNFSYKRKTLVGLSLNNREGQLLGLLLENSDLFVSDELIDTKFRTYDTLGRSDLVKLLKNKFKFNKLTAIIKRQGKGYILIKISPLYIN